MKEDLEVLRGFNMTNETDKLRRNVYIYGIVNASILLIGLIASIISLVEMENIGSGGVVAGNAIFMSALEIVVILIILRMFSHFLNDDKTTQIMLQKCKRVILDGRYDEEVKVSYRPTRVYSSFNTLLMIHIFIVIIDVILSIAFSNYRSWVVLSASILNMVGTLLELFLLINISKFLTLRERESKKCVEILNKVNNMKDGYQINDMDLNEGIPDLLVKMSLYLCIMLGVLYIATTVIFIVAIALKLMWLSPISIISMVIGGALDIYLIYFLKGYFKYQKEFTLAIKAAISILREESKSYFEGFNSIFK